MALPDYLREMARHKAGESEGPGEPPLQEEQGVMDDLDAELSRERAKIDRTANRGKNRFIREDIGTEVTKEAVMRQLEETINDDMVKAAQEYRTTLARRPIQDMLRNALQVQGRSQPSPSRPSTPTLPAIHGTTPPATETAAEMIKRAEPEDWVYGVTRLQRLRGPEEARQRDLWMTAARRACSEKDPSPAAGMINDLIALAPFPQDLEEAARFSKEGSKRSLRMIQKQDSESRERAAIVRRIEEKRVKHTFAYPSAEHLAKDSL